MNTLGSAAGTRVITGPLV